MSVTTKTVWGEGFNETHKAQWDALKSNWLSAAVDAGKTDGQGVGIDGIPYGGTRVWVDQESADGWKALVLASATKIGIPATVTME